MQAPRALIPPFLLAAALAGGAPAGCSDQGASPADTRTEQPDSGAADLPAPADQGGEQAADLAPQPDAPRWGDCLPEAELAPFVLAEGYCLVGRAPLSSAAVSAIAISSGRFWTLSAGGKPWGQIAVATGAALEEASLFFGFNPADTDNAFTGDYLALSPAGRIAAGYTFGSTFAGALVLADEAGQALGELAQATGNFDAVFWDDEALLVNGSGLGEAQQGQGVYLHRPGHPSRKLIDEMGLASGFLAVGEQLLFAGSYFSSGNQLLAFTREEVQAAIDQGSTLRATDGDLIYAGDMLDATALGDDLVISTVDALWAFTAVLRISTIRDGDLVAPLDAIELVSGGQGDMVRNLAGVTPHLGLLLTGPTGEAKEIALVRER